VDPANLVIAATAERFAAELWTLNVGHFRMFPRLVAPY
jgi:predicted nucleic acid-binding protein